MVNLVPPQEGKRTRREVYYTHRSQRGSPRACAGPHRSPTGSVFNWTGGEQWEPGPVGQSLHWDPEWGLRKANQVGEREEGKRRRKGGGAGRRGWRRGKLESRGWVAYQGVSAVFECAFTIRAVRRMLICQSINSKWRILNTMWVANTSPNCHLSLDFAYADSIWFI